MFNRLTEFENFKLLKMKVTFTNEPEVQRSKT